MKIRNFFKWADIGEVSLISITGASLLNGDWMLDYDLKKEIPNIPQSALDDFNEAIEFHQKAVDTGLIEYFIRARDSYLKLEDVLMPDQKKKDLLYESAVVTLNVYKLCEAWGEKNEAIKYKTRHKQLTKQSKNG